MKKLSIFLLLFALGIYSCSDDEVTRVKKIGAILSLTGHGASLGESANEALKIGLSDANDYLKDNSAGFELELTVFDSQSDANEALKQLKALHSMGIDIVIGPQLSNNCAAVLEYANENGIILLSPTSVAISLAIEDDNLYRLTPSDIHQAKAIAKMLEHDGIKKVAAIRIEDVWSDDLYAQAKNEMEALGIQVDVEETYNANVDNFNGTLTSLQSHTENQYGIPADDIAIYMICFDEGMDILEDVTDDDDKIYDYMSEVKWYGSSAFAQDGNLLSNQNAVDLAILAGLPCPVFGLDEEFEYAYGPVKEKLTAKLGHEADVYAYAAYDAVRLLALTYERAGYNADIETARESLIYQADHYGGATGETTFNAAGDRKYADYIFWAPAREEGSYFWIEYATYKTSDGSLQMK